MSTPLSVTWAGLRQSLSAVVTYLEAHPPRIESLVVLIGLPAVLSVMATVDVSALFPFPICGFRNVTGMPCPGCGMTRAVTAFLHGDLLGATRFNPLVVAVIPWTGYLWLRTLQLVSGFQIVDLRHPRYRSLRTAFRGTWVAVAVMGMVWVVRIGMTIATGGLDSTLRKGWLYPWVTLTISFVQRNLSAN